MRSNITKTKINDKGFYFYSVDTILKLTDTRISSAFSLNLKLICTRGLMTANEIRKIIHTVNRTTKLWSGTNMSNIKYKMFLNEPEAGITCRIWEKSSFCPNQRNNINFSLRLQILKMNTYEESRKIAYSLYTRSK